MIESGRYTFCCLSLPRKGKGQNFNEVQKENKKSEDESRERLLYFQLPVSSQGDGEKREHLDVL